MMALLKFAGLMSQTSSNYSLTRRGAFWVHLAQNYFSLRSINTIWTRALAEPFPDRIEF